MCPTISTTLHTSNGNDIETNAEWSFDLDFLTFSILKQNKPAYSRTCKDRSEANLEAKWILFIP